MRQLFVAPLVAAAVLVMLPVPSAQRPKEVVAAGKVHVKLSSTVVPSAAKKRTASESSREKPSWPSSTTR